MRQKWFYLPQSVLFEVVIERVRYLEIHYKPVLSYGKKFQNLSIKAYSFQDVPWRRINNYWLYVDMQSVVDKFYVWFLRLTPNSWMVQLKGRRWKILWVDTFYQSLIADYPVFILWHEGGVWFCTFIAPMAKVLALLM